MRTNRECTNREQNRERGVVGLVLLGLIVVAMAVAAFFLVARKQDGKTAATETQNTVETPADSQFSEETALQRNQVNTQRRVDAAGLLSAASEYANNNMGSLPRQIYDYMTDGFDYYDNASLAMGAQGPVITDELRLVIGGTCAKDGSTVAGSPRDIAVQYGVRDSGDRNTFNSECREA